MSKWTEEQLDAVWNEVALGEVCSSSALCAALLDAREQVATLRAEVKAWREWEPEGDMGPLDEPRGMGRLRAATDALFKEGL